MVAIRVHCLFADGSDKAIEKEGATLVTTDTVPYASNRIEIAGLLAPATVELSRQAATVAQKRSALDS